MDWEGKALQCRAMTLEPFAKYVRQRQEVSEEFWTVLAPVIGGSLHNFYYLGDKAGHVESGAEEKVTG